MKLDEGLSDGYSSLRSFDISGPNCFQRGNGCGRVEALLLSAHDHDTRGPH